MRRSLPAAVVTLVLALTLSGCAFDSVAHPTQSPETPGDTTVAGDTATLSERLAGFGPVAPSMAPVTVIDTVRPAIGVAIQSAMGPDTKFATLYQPPASCVRTSALVYVCPSTVSYGMTSAVDYTFFDASSSVMAAYNATTTAAVRSRASRVGTYTMYGATETQRYTRTRTIGNLLGAETARIWTGSDSLIRLRRYRVTTTLVDSTGTGFRGDYVIDDSSVVLGTLGSITVPVGGRVAAYPASGTYTVVSRHWVRAAPVTTGPLRVRTAADTAVVTFNGTRFPSVTVGALTKRLDLNTGAVN